MVINLNNETNLLTRANILSFGFLLADIMIRIKQVYRTNLTNLCKSIDGWVNTSLKFLFP